jgi:hypothetical protein
VSDAKTVGEAVRSAAADLNTASPDKAEKVEKIEREAPESKAVDDDDADFGAPGWVKQWKKPSRAALRKLASMEGAADLLPDVYKEIESRYDYSGKTQAELEKLRKRFDPYDSVLSSYEQRAAMQGISPQVGLQQMLAVQDGLYRNPDQTIPWLLQQLKPNDAKAIVNTMARHWGVDLGQIAQAEPWVDPAVKQLVEPLRAQNMQMQNMLQGFYQQQYQQNAQAVANSIAAFKNAQDENGNPKYPHYARLENSMAALIRAGHAPDLEKLYEQALWGDPELREELIQAKAKAAELRAAQASQDKNAQAEKAVVASRNISGSATKAREIQPKDLRAAIKRNAKKLA